MSPAAAGEGVRGRREERPWPLGVAVCVEEEEAEESDCAGERERTGVDAEEDEADDDGSGRVARMREAVAASVRSWRKDWTYCCCERLLGAVLYGHDRKTRTWRTSGRSSRS